MAMLIDSLGNGMPEHPIFADQAALPAPPLPALPQLGGHGEQRPLPAPQAEARPAAPTTSTTEQQAQSRTEGCRHLQTTGAGSNQHFRVVKCKDCGHVVSRTRRETTTTTPASDRNNCQHYKVTWRGSNAFQKVRTCLQCGLRTTFREDTAASGPSTSTTTASTPAAATTLSEQLLTPLEARRVVETFAHAMNIKLQQVESQQAVPAARLQEALRLTIEQSALWASEATPSPSTTQTPTQATASQSPHGHPATPQSPSLTSMVRRGSEMVTFGRFKGKAARDAWNDAGYRAWVMGEARDTGHRGLKQLNQFFLDYKDYLDNGNPAAFMASTLDTDGVSQENDLIAILDTGCNQSCHGERWLQRYAAATNTTPAFVDEECPTFRGINGTVRTTGARNIDLCLELLNGGLARGDLRSTELADSDAPLLISLQAQRSLGLVLDIAAEVAHSQTLGADLKLVIKDGLLGLRLLPADVVMDNNDDDFYNDGPDGPDGEQDDGAENDEGGTETETAAELASSYLAIDPGYTRTMTPTCVTSRPRTTTFGTSSPPRTSANATLFCQKAAKLFFWKSSPAWPCSAPWRPLTMDIPSAHPSTSATTRTTTSRQRLGGRTSRTSSRRTTPTPSHSHRSVPLERGCCQRTSTSTRRPPAMCGNQYSNGLERSPARAWPKDVRSS